MGARRDRAVAPASGFPVASKARSWSASSPTATCVETRLDEPVKSIMTPREPRHGQGRHAARRSEGAGCTPPPRARAGRQRRVRTARPDDRQGHHEADRAPGRVQDEHGSQRRRGGRRRSRQRRACRAAGAGRRRRDRRRYRARPQQGCARAFAGSSRTSARRSDRRQHRDGRRREGASSNTARMRSRSVSARLRSARRGSLPVSASADQRDRERRGSAEGHGRAVHRRRRRAAGDVSKRLAAGARTR